MSGLIDVAARTSAILLAGLSVRAALKWKERSAALRHFVLAAAMGAAVGVIPLSLVLPSWDLSLPVSFPRAGSAAVTPPGARVSPATGTNAAATTSTAPGTRRPQATAPARRSMLVWAWLTGCVVFAAMLAAGLFRLGRVASRASVVSDGRWLRTADAVARAYGLRRRVVVLRTDAPDLLATCGMFRPRVLIPSHALGWPDDRIHVVLSHELAHVRRFDWPIQIGAEVIRAILWFNPFIWIACTYLRRDSEQACDDVVLGRGVESREYASHLLDLARTCRRSPALPLPATPMGRPSTLERRIADMLNVHLDRRPLSIRTLGIACALLLAVTLPTAALRAAQTAPATLQGTVYDTTGGVMPGVAVTLEDVTQMKYTATTDAVGRFAFSNVQPGHYTLEAAQPGFRTLRQAFDLTTRRDWDRVIMLQLGTLQETITVSERRVTPPAAAAAKPAPVRVGGAIRVPLKTRDVHPIYPASMRDAGREGAVPIEAIIGVDGTVTSVRVLSAQVHPDFAIAAVDAVRQWRFTPTLLNGSPVEVVMNVDVTFKLSDQ